MEKKPCFKEGCVPDISGLKMGTYRHMCKKCGSYTTFSIDSKGYYKVVYRTTQQVRNILNQTLFAQQSIVHPVNFLDKIIVP